MIVATRGGLLDVTEQWMPNPSLSRVALYGSHYYAYAELYRRQPNVRTCVEFLGRNVAQLGLHVYRRASETDRVRMRTGALADLIKKPNPFTTTYRLIEALMGDLGIYHSAYWLKMRQGAGAALLRVPPDMMTVHGGLMPTRYDVEVGGRRYVYQPDQVVHFRGYNPLSSTVGLSPMETLRRILAEEDAMGRHREGYWDSAARMSGIIERPAEAPEWSPTARERFTAEFEMLYAGESNAGKTAVLEEGMSWKGASFSARDSEYLSTRKLTREECARAYHIPLPMVGILDHATFSNIKEQHKNLYQDSLGPWLAMIEQDIELQLLPDLADADEVYVEFNIQEKLAGSFEDQTSSLQTAVGRPWMTANEARAKFNLPSLEGDADELALPLNVTTGDQVAEPEPDADPEPDDDRAKSLPLIKTANGEIDPTQPRLLERHEAKWAQMIRKTFRRQRDAVLAGVPKKAVTEQDINALWDQKRWNSELSTDYYRLNRLTGLAWANYVGQELDAEIDEARMDEWFMTRARIGAEEINEHTRDLVAHALTEELAREAIEHVFDIAVTTRAIQIAANAVRMASTFGSQEGARQGGLRKKTWIVRSSNPRPEHAAMNGQTVAIHEMFSNGMRWPHDPNGGPDNNSGCQCAVTFGR